MSKAGAVLAAAAALCACDPAFAQTDAETSVLPRVIAHGCFDLVRDLNGCEQVTLLASETDPDLADLLVWPDRRNRDAGGPLLVVRGAVFSGPMWGQEPTLTPVAGGFILASGQSAIGRFPWSEGLTVRHDGTDFVVAAYSYGAYDRMTGATFTCDLDLVTGEWRHETVRPDPESEDAPEEVTAASGRLDTAPVRLADWSAFGAMPAPCSAASGGLYAD
ncbi:hypothetical protein HKCCE2091_09755 [Rhodobacterales bacterium HKCCE2091]|nr:hypothetical protein [Rhodobacterales bacterium HKCCE2091]